MNWESERGFNCGAHEELESDFIEIQRYMGRTGGKWRVKDIPSEAGRAGGQWPSAKNLTDRLIAWAGRTRLSRG